jgi:hypothetical protein
MINYYLPGEEKGRPIIENMIDLIRADNNGQKYHIENWRKNKQKRNSEEGLDFVHDFA